MFGVVCVSVFVSGVFVSSCLRVFVSSCVGVAACAVCACVRECLGGRVIVWLCVRTFV